MIATCRSSTPFGCALLLLALGAPVSAHAQTPGNSEEIVVIDFASFPAGRRYPITATSIPLRRGVVSTVRIVKHFIDLVPDGQIEAGGSGMSVQHPLHRTIHGRTTGGIGFIEMKVRVDAGAQGGDEIRVGASDKFSFDFFPMNRITALVYDPNATTVAAGTPITVRVEGEDFEANIANLACHAVARGSRGPAFLRDTLRRSSSPECLASGGQFAFNLQFAPMNPPMLAAFTTGSSEFRFGPYAQSRHRITPASVEVTEPSASIPNASAHAVFTVETFGAAIAQPVTVQYATSPGTAASGKLCKFSGGPLLPAGDFIAQQGTLTFAPGGPTTQEVRVSVCPDLTEGEAPETFTVTLSNAVNATITSATGTATIR
jgi:hypothetical protein